jgi:AcrR family transcriptional regulator
MTYGHICLAVGNRQMVVNHSVQVTPGPSTSFRKLANRRERRRAETERRLLRSALQLFAERGFMATTVEDITNGADVGKGTFFNYFPSKEHILGALAQIETGKVQKFVSQNMNSIEPMDGLLYKLALIITREYDRNPALVRSILVPLFSSGPAGRLMVDAFERDRLSLAELMAERRRRGEIRDDLPPIDLARQFQQALFGATVLWSLAPSKPLSGCLKEMSGILWSGIRAPKKRRSQ